MFSSEFNPTPSIAYKAYSKLQSSKDISMVISRIKKIPELERGLIVIINGKNAVLCVPDEIVELTLKKIGETK